MNDPEFRLVAANKSAASYTWSVDQIRVLKEKNKSNLVLGSPGVGKTTVLIEKVARQVATGRSLDSILVLTHTRRMAQQLRSALIRRLGGAHLGVRVTTVHGYCLSLIKRFYKEDATQLRLLTAPEQEFHLRELLAGHDINSWPPELAAAAKTRLFASQLRAVLARARQLGFDPKDLTSFADIDPVWGAVGDFFEEYLTVLDFESALDYTELVHRSRLLLQESDVQESVRAELSEIYCDEFAELDDSQLGLIGDLCSLGIELTAFADPNQAIFRFRGAGNSPLKWFIDRFGNKNLQLLSTNYRGGEQLVKSWRRLASYIPAASQTGVNWQHSKSAFPGGEVRVVIYDDPEAEISHLAQQLRHAHLRDGIPWRECAVITRTARAELMPIARSLRQSGIPVEMAGDEIVLAKQLAVRPLLLVLQVAEAETIDPDQAHRLLTSPLAGLDAVKLREIGRQLRASQKIRAELPKPSAQLLADWLQNPQLADLTDGEPIIKLAELLGQVRELIAQDASVHQMLWQLWSGTDWPGQLQESALAGDLQANADLDAVCELFEVAAAGQHLRGRSGILAFLTDISGQMIAADTARESDLRGRGVQLMTAHRAKGEQFRQVYILGAREGNWPKLIRRGSLLEPEMLSADGIGPVDITSQLPAERRLFYVACSRATEKLVVSGTHGMEGEGERPSRFLAELGIEIERVTGRANRPLTLTGLTTDLRAVSVDPTAEPGLRKAAAARLAKLAQAKDRRGHQLVPAADPQNWWGLRELTKNEELVPKKLRFVGTDLADILECPRRWFLARRVRADNKTSSAASLGAVVHLLAQHALTSELSYEDIGDHLEAVWTQIPFEAAWLSAAEKATAEEALERIFAWQQANEHRNLVGVEVDFSVDVKVADQVITLAGSVDRLERDADGRLRIIDFKTSRTIPSKNEIADHEQLGLYQLAATQGAFERIVPGERRVADAELVFARGQDAHGSWPWPKVVKQQSLDEVPHLSDADKQYPTWVHHKLAQATKIASSGEYRALRCASCRFCAFQNGCPALASNKEVLT